MSTTALLLHRVPLFASLDSDDLERIVRTTRVETHRSATVIIREGDLDDRRFYVVAQGRVAVLKHYGTKQQRHLNELGPGAFFGEMALLGDAPRSATVVAVSSSGAVAAARRSPSTVDATSSGETVSRMASSGISARTP